MKRVLKLAAVAAAGLVVPGCGTLQLNPIVTGTACSTRDACLKDLNLPNPEKPEYVFFLLVIFIVPHIILSIIPWS
ncbi:MAG: hypothetical protein M0Z59_06770 [Nitrospiraceae bacterium]|nr:hypothetical protein [Nitrospiraceae bacterium]